MNRFETLVQDIKDILGPSSGLTSEDVDVGDLTLKMERYVSDEKEWSKYALGNANMAYTRNLVDEGNGKANLLILVWTPGKASPIHDHGNAHCLMRVLRGSITETRYDYPDGKEAPMQIKKETTLKEGAVAYMADNLGLHQVANPGSDYAVSLHLYTPPNVAKFGCNIFSPKTGKMTHVPKCGNYSKFGERVED
ncbi:cysteine dioxygenase type I [Hypoxylon fragiforme]|uniref:cysteine dioxygenase type I n=1 Tax=Hypoxylon fragiforme TaxID=63214 RepID=UPI0020C72780|nr:cysteine dioxygenase type I [Hypoxylon fragiforme]KAI2609418.1 cysteine dioxygenase type I [Hypoxylon fragiforme]